VIGVFAGIVGNVLAAGGASSNSLGLNSSEIYNVSTGQWTSTGDMLTQRYSFEMVLLPNGLVLAAGGYDLQAVSAIASAELYNPADGTWSQTAPLTIPREVLQMKVLHDGSVLAAGGLNNNYVFATTLSSCQVYTFNSTSMTGSWSDLGPMATARFGFQMTVLPNGDVLAAGGANLFNAVVFNSTEIYDTTSRSWSPSGTMNAMRYYFQMVTLPNGRALGAAGFQPPAGPTADVSPTNGAIATWAPTGQMVSARTLFQMVLL
jgi:hypothetical protein